MQTPFGKGVVREVRNNHRLLVDVQGRALVVSDADVTALDAGRLSGRPGPSAFAKASADRRSAKRGGRSGPGEQSSRRRPGSSGSGIEIDLHGLTVEEALARVESALNEALLADVDVLRLIHGRSGGRIRAALHQRLRALASVRGFRIDPRNEGVTIVTL